MKKHLTYVILAVVSLLMFSCDEQVDWELKYQEADLLVVEGKGVVTLPSSASEPSSSTLSPTCLSSMARVSANTMLIRGALSWAVSPIT